MEEITRQSAKYCNDFWEFLNKLELFGERPALTWFTRQGEKKTKTYFEFVSDVKALRKVFIQRQLAGKHLALVGENSYEWLLVYFAAVSCGGVAVCIDVEQSEETIKNMVEWADSEAIFVSTSCSEIFGEDKKNVFKLDSKENSRISVNQLLETAYESSVLQEEENIVLTGLQTAAIVYTSGTTDISKPVMLSQRALLINAEESNQVVDVGSPTFSSLPFCHTYGLTCALTASLLRGAELVFNGDIRTTMRDMKLSGAYSILTVPLVVEVLYQQMWNWAEQSGKAKELKKVFKYQTWKHKLGLRTMPSEFDEIRKNLVGTIKLIICGGAHLDCKMAETMKLLGMEILEGYGITECSPLVSVNEYKNNRLRTVGKPLPSCKVRIKEGEIQVSGPCVMSGYYKMNEETKKVMKDGWFCTGDLGEIDKDGYLKITGRSKNLIVFKNGKKVSPEIYEEKLKKIPVVEEVLVYGASAGGSLDDVKIVASIYPNQTMVKEMSSYEILETLQTEIDKLNNTLPFYQQIQMMHIRDEEFDKNTMRKIKRYTV